MSSESILKGIKVLYDNSTNEDSKDFFDNFIKIYNRNKNGEKKYNQVIKTSYENIPEIFDEFFAQEYEEICQDYIDSLNNLNEFFIDQETNIEEKKEQNILANLIITINDKRAMFNRRKNKLLQYITTAKEKNIPLEIGNNISFNNVLSNELAKQLYYNILINTKKLEKNTSDKQIDNLKYHLNQVTKQILLYVEDKEKFKDQKNSIDKQIEKQNQKKSSEENKEQPILQENYSEPEENFEPVAPPEEPINSEEENAQSEEDNFYIDEDEDEPEENVDQTQSEQDDEENDLSTEEEEDLSEEQTQQSEIIPSQNFREKYKLLVDKINSLIKRLAIADEEIKTTYDLINSDTNTPLLLKELNSKEQQISKFDLMILETRKSLLDLEMNEYRKNPIYYAKTDSKLKNIKIDYSPLVTQETLQSFYNKHIKIINAALDTINYLQHEDQSDQLNAKIQVYKTLIVNEKNAINRRIMLEVNINKSFDVKEFLAANRGKINTINNDKQKGNNKGINFLYDQILEQLLNRYVKNGKLKSKEYIEECFYKIVDMLCYSNYNVFIEKQDDHYYYVDNNKNKTLINFADFTKYVTNNHANSINNLIEGQNNENNPIKLNTKPDELQNVDTTKATIFRLAMSKDFINVYTDKKNNIFLDIKDLFAEKLAEKLGGKYQVISPNNKILKPNVKLSGYKSYRVVKDENGEELPWIIQVMDKDNNIMYEIEINRNNKTFRQGL